MNRKKITLNEEINRMSQLFRHMGIPAKLIKEGISGPGTGLQILKGLETGSAVAKSLPRASEAMRVGFLENLGKKGIASLEEMKTKFGGTMEEAATAFLKTLPEAEQTLLLSKFTNIVSDENIAALTGLEKTPNIEVAIKEEGNSVLEILQKRKTSGGNLTEFELSVINDSIIAMESKAAGNTTITNVVNGVKAEVDMIQNPIGTTTNEVSGLLTKFPDIANDYNLATVTQKNYANQIVEQLSDEQAIKMINNLKDPIKIQEMAASYGNKWDNIESGYKRILRMFEATGSTVKPKSLLNIAIGCIIVWAFFYYAWPIIRGDENIKLPTLTLDSKDKNCIDNVTGSDTLTEEQLSYATTTFGCRRTKEDTTKNKIVMFEKIDDEKFKARTEGGCIETHSGGIDGKLESAPCTKSDNDNDGDNSDNDNNNDEENNNDENPEDENTNCKLTSTKVGSYCTTNKLTCKNISINTDDCTATWTDEDGEQVTYTAKDMGLS